MSTFEIGDRVRIVNPGATYGKSSTYAGYAEQEPEFVIERIGGPSSKTWYRTKWGYHSCGWYAESLELARPLEHAPDED